MEPLAMAPKCCDRIIFKRIYTWKRSSLDGRKNLASSLTRDTPADIHDGFVV